MKRRDDDGRAEQYLRMIERTRLLRNTTAEMEELVDFSIGKGNGLARMGGRSPFIKDAIVRELAHIAKEETELDLQEVLDTYQEADLLLGRMGKVKDAESLCQQLIWHFFAYLDCTIEDGQITFEPRTTEGLWFRLRRLSRGESSQRLTKLLENDQYAQADSYPEDTYDFTLCLAAITSDHIYIKKDERQYYKIAKSLHPLLADVRFADNIGVITFAKATSSDNEMSQKTYVAFDDINLYYDVSTPMAMEQADIQIADAIRED